MCKIYIAHQLSLCTKEIKIHKSKIKKPGYENIVYDIIYDILVMSSYLINLICNHCALPMCQIMK